MQVALSLAESELSAFEAEASRQTAAATAHSDSTSTATLIHQFRHQKRSILVRAVTRLRQGVEQLETDA